jgi:hypothetical protein
VAGARQGDLGARQAVGSHGHGQGARTHAAAAEGAARHSAAPTAHQLCLQNDVRCTCCHLESTCGGQIPSYSHTMISAKSQVQGLRPCAHVITLPCLPIYRAGSTIATADLEQTQGHAHRRPSRGAPAAAAAAAARRAGH